MDENRRKDFENLKYWNHIVWFAIGVFLIIIFVTSLLGWGPIQNFTFNIPALSAVLTDKTSSETPSTDGKGSQFECIAEALGSERAQELRSDKSSATPDERQKIKDCL